MPYRKTKKEKQTNAKVKVCLTALAASTAFFGAIKFEEKLCQKEIYNYTRKITLNPIEMVYSIEGNNASLREIDGYTKVSFPGEVQTYYKLPTGEQTRDISRTVFSQPDGSYNLRAYKFEKNQQLQKQNSLEKKARNE